MRCVAPPYRGCNTQLSAQPTDAKFAGAVLTDPDLRRLQTAAMRACDHWGDDEAARREMRRQVAEVPAHLRAELLQYFDCTYPAQEVDPWAR